MTRKPTLPALLMECGRVPVFVAEFPNALEHFQRVVGGLIDVVNVERELIAMLDAMFETAFGPRACVVVADDMYPESMPLNEFASMLAGQAVYGDALFCDVP